MSTTDAGKPQKSGDRLAELLAQAARREEAMRASGYQDWVVTNLARGDAWAKQDTGLAKRTALSKALERDGLRVAKSQTRHYRKLRKKKSGV